MVTSALVDNYDGHFWLNGNTSAKWRVFKDQLNFAKCQAGMNECFQNRAIAAPDANGNYLTGDIAQPLPLDFLKPGANTIQGDVTNQQRADNLSQMARIFLGLKISYDVAAGQSCGNVTVQ
jgi:hypothetical protein